MLRLHIESTNPKQTQQPITDGRWFVVLGADEQVWVLLEGTQAHLSARLLAYIDVDERGIWLHLQSGTDLIHVNGRPVRRIAFLRIGDLLHVHHGSTLHLRGFCQSLGVPPETDAQMSDDVCITLRGISGKYHGRCFTLERPRILGSDSQADMVIDDPDIPAQQLRFERHEGHVLLRILDEAAGEPCQVNGVAVRHCWLQPGDQILCANNQRFVLEAPIAIEEPVTPASPMRALSPHHWYWLLPVAGLMGLLIAGLLLFGMR